jgi:hypothetical protein
MVNLLPFSIGPWDLKTKSKPSGLPDSNVIFFVATKKTKQKKAWRCAGHVWFDMVATSIRMVLVDQESTIPPQVTRLLRASPFVEGCSARCAFKLFSCRLDGKRGPL